VGDHVAVKHIPVLHLVYSAFVRIHLPQAFVSQLTAQFADEQLRTWISRLVPRHAKVHDSHMVDIDIMPGLLPMFVVTLLVKHGALAVAIDNTLISWSCVLHPPAPQVAEEKMLMPSCCPCATQTAERPITMRLTRFMCEGMANHKKF